MKIEEKARFTVGNLSDVGMVRESNQDYYGRYSGDFGELLLVCDGMGGYKGGEVASQVAVETIASHFQKLGAHFQESNELHQALSLAQQNIAAHAQHNPEMSEMGTPRLFCSSGVNTIGLPGLATAASICAAAERSNRSAGTTLWCRKWWIMA